MEKPLDQHQVEILRNKTAWENKPILRELYAAFYERIARWIDPAVPGGIVELGSGIGNLKATRANVIATDLFPNPWLDLVCDAYELPFADESLSHLVLFDVFHHLEHPLAFFEEALRALGNGGRVLLFEPYISAASYPAYGWAHHEPIGWGNQIDFSRKRPGRSRYYAAQGNATRLFFRGELRDIDGFKLLHKQAFASFAYLLSGGFSKPALYPAPLKPLLVAADSALSLVPPIFGARCLVVLQKVAA
ncbi:MAG TPA: class I SAM-dependent methyltransferase [Methylomirabilota bacterium]|nr:class I SAM-dependent methyltransferase [Methylomirabilota bacterium]